MLKDALNFLLPNDCNLAFDYFNFNFFFEVGFFFERFGQKKHPVKKSPSDPSNVWLHLLNIGRNGASSPLNCSGRIYLIWIPFSPGFITWIFHFSFFTNC